MCLLLIIVAFRSVSVAPFPIYILKYWSPIEYVYLFIYFSLGDTENLEGTGLGQNSTPWSTGLSFWWCPLVTPVHHIPSHQSHKGVSWASPWKDLVGFLEGQLGSMLPTPGL